MLWASKSSCGRFCLSRPKQPFPHSRSSGSSHRPDADGGARPLPSVRAPNTQRRLRRLHLCKAFRAGFKCASCWTALSRHILYPYGRPYLGNGCGACRGGPLPAHSPSFHQAWPSAFAAPGLQPALCLHIPRGSFHQAPGRQRSSIAACPLPAHSPLLLGPSSLPFARLQTPKTPKTLPCLHIALSC